MKKNSFIVLIFVLSGCSSVQSKKIQDLSPSQFELLKIGDPAGKVISLLGPPSDVRKNLKNTPDELWVYDDLAGSQRGAISMDPKNQSITAVTIIPKESDRESKLDFLLKTKFAPLTFEEAPLQRCGRDYVPAEVFYVSVEKGILVEGRRGSPDVERFSWTSPHYAAGAIKRIKECKR